MATTIVGNAKAIFDRIESLFIDQVGPIGAILAQEAIDLWSEQLAESDQKPSLRNISGYLSLLEKDIINPDDKKSFIEAVFEIKALEHYKENYIGENS